jgi:hypothetical protein
VSDPGTRRRIDRTLVAAWRQLCYKLTYHNLFSISLKRWIWMLVVVPPVVAWIGRIAWRWAVPLSVVGAVALFGAERARRRQYVHFAPSVSPDAEDTHKGARSLRRYAPELESVLHVDEPLRCWASGLLGVEGRTRAIAGERASVSYVRTREHVVMAQVRRTRFMLLAPVSKGDVGYWYAFFRPDRVQAVRLGMLYCGLAVRPGIELRYACEGPGRQQVELYLAFEDLSARQRLLDDLRRDVGSEAF